MEILPPSPSGLQIPTQSQCCPLKKNKNPTDHAEILLAAAAVAGGRCCLFTVPLIAVAFPQNGEKHNYGLRRCNSTVGPLFTRRTFMYKTNISKDKICSFGLRMRGRGSMDESHLWDLLLRL